MSVQNFSQTGNFSASPIDNAVLSQSAYSKLHQPGRHTFMPHSIKVNQSQSIPVASTVHAFDPNVDLPCVTTGIQNKLLESAKIRIKCQPRSKFRPRTQNESRSSSHYLRCEDGTLHEHPTIYVPREWACQSNTNIIEVALVDIHKQSHPYIIDNKSSRSTFDDEGLVFKSNDSNVLYFRLTNQDILMGFKSFMIELIKCRQDEGITKELIRRRKLDQSMLCFTRLVRNEYGVFQRDVSSEEYSCIMTENYGEITVEHLGPQYGPMRGQETMFFVFKGRIAKEDLSVTITEPTTDWSQNIKDFMINSSFICFSMPAFPYPQITRVNASVNIFCKQQTIHQSTYLYTSVLDQELAKYKSDAGVSLISKSPDQLQIGILTGRPSAPVAIRKTSKDKPSKRLNSK